MAQNPRHLLEAKIKKLQQLHELMGDPEVAAEVSQLFSHRNGSVSEAVKPAPAAAKTHHAKAKAKAKKVRGDGAHNMVRAAKEIVLASTVPLNARSVADQMAAQGFRFSAKDKYVAVSKALRWLATRKEIGAHKSGSAAKAPILYSRPGAAAPAGAAGEHPKEPANTAFQGAGGVPVSPSAMKVVNYLRTHGPSRWTAIMESTGVGASTLHTALTKHPTLFRKRPDNDWEVTA